jgi:hypothetical protein
MIARRNLDTVRLFAVAPIFSQAMQLLMPAEDKYED